MAQYGSGKWRKGELEEIARERLQLLEASQAKLAAGHETIPWQYKGTERSAKRFREKDCSGQDWVYLRFRVPDVTAAVLARTAADPRFRQEYVPHVNLGKYASHVEFFMMDPNTCSELETCYSYRRVYYKLAKRWTAEYAVNVAHLELSDGQHVVMDCAVDRPNATENAIMVINSLVLYTDAKRRGGCEVHAAFSFAASGTVGKVLRKMIIAGNEIKYATGIVRMPLLDHFAKALESEEGQAILRCHMRAHDRVETGLRNFLGALLWPLSICGTPACVVSE